MELGIWEFAKVATVWKERWGRDWNLEYGNFEFARRERFITRNKERWRGRDWNLARVVDGGVTATGVLSRERGNLITICITLY